MKVSKGKTQPEIVADIPFEFLKHGSGFTIIPIGFEQVTHLGSPAQSSGAPSSFIAAVPVSRCHTALQRCPELREDIMLADPGSYRFVWWEAGKSDRGQVPRNKPTLGEN